MQDGDLLYVYEVEHAHVFAAPSQVEPPPPHPHPQPQPQPQPHPHPDPSPSPDQVEPGAAPPTRMLGGRETPLTASDRSGEMYRDVGER